MKLSDVLRQKDKRHILLIGKRGSGKTTMMIKSFSDLSTDEMVIPLYIPAYAYDNDADYIKRYILHNYLGRRPDGEGNIENDFVRLKGMLGSSNYDIYLFVDGVQENPFDEIGNIYYEINDLSAIHNVLIILSCEYDTNRLKGFRKYFVSEIDEELLLRKIPDYLLLNDKMKFLLRQPFYCSKYNSIILDEKHHINTACGLLQLFYNEQNEKVIVPSTAMCQDGYYNYAKNIINSFLTFFCVRLVEIQTLSFKEKESDSMFENWKEELPNSEKKIAEYPFSYIETWKSFGIIIEINGKYYIDEQSRDYFAAVSLSQTIRRNPYALTCMENLFENGNVVRYVGELIGENEFANKSDSYGPSSPIELILNNFRKTTGNFGGIIAMYIEIMKSCRDKRIRADYHDLDLSLTNFIDCDVSYSNFEGCIFPEAPFLNDNINNLIIGALFRPEKNDSVLYGGHGYIYIMNTLNGVCKKKQVHSNSENIQVAALINDFNFCVSATWDDVVATELSTGKYKKICNKVHKKHIFYIYEAPDTNEFVMASRDCVSLWNSKNLKKIKHVYWDLKDDGSKYDICFVNDRKILYVNRSNQIMVYNLSNDKSEVFFNHFKPNSKIIAIVRDNCYGDLAIVTETKIHIYKELYKQNADKVVYDEYTINVDLTNCKIVGMDFVNSDLLLSTDKRMTYFCRIKAKKIYIEYSGLSPINLFLFPKIQNKKILYVGMLGNCSLFNFDLKEEKCIRASNLLMGGALECVEDSICLIKGRSIKFFDLKTLDCKKTLTFENVIYPHIIKRIHNIPYIIFSVTGDNRIFYYNCLNDVCKSWEFKMCSVLFSLDISEDGKTLLLFNGEAYAVWNIANMDNPAFVRKQDSNAFDGALIGECIVEHNSISKKITISYGEKRFDFDSNISAPINNFIIENEFAKYYVEYNYHNEKISCYTNNIREEFEPNIIQVKPYATVYKCARNMFCVLSDGLFEIYILDKKAIYKQSEIFIPEYKNVTLFHRQLLITIRDRDFIIYDGDVLNFYTIKGKREKQQIKVLNGIDIYGANFINSNINKKNEAHYKTKRWYCIN